MSMWCQALGSSWIPGLQSLCHCSEHKKHGESEIVRDCLMFGFSGLIPELNNNPRGAATGRSKLSPVLFLLPRAAAGGDGGLSPSLQTQHQGQLFPRVPPPGTEFSSLGSAWDSGSQAGKDAAGEECSGCRRDAAGGRNAEEMWEGCSRRCSRRSAANTL